MAEENITLGRVLKKIKYMDENHRFQWVCSLLKEFGSEVTSTLYHEAYEQGRFDEAMECSTPKVELPDYVSHWLEYCKATHITLMCALRVWDTHLYNYARMSDKNKLRSYLMSDENQENFMSAWVNGYSVKKEKYYYVAVPVEQGRFMRLYVLANGSVALGGHSYESIELLKKHSRQATYQLTEKLIKESPLSWAWQFAKELED